MMREFAQLKLKPVGTDWLQEVGVLWDIPEEENGFRNVYKHTTLTGYREEVLPRLIKESHASGIDPMSGRVPQTYYFLWDGDAIVGLMKLRHQLNDELRRHVGHVGYSILPRYRERGYATAGLRLLLKEADKILFDESLLLFTEASNVASQRVIVANGGNCYYDDGVLCKFKISLRRQYSHCWN